MLIERYNQIRTGVGIDISQMGGVAFMCSRKEPWFSGRVVTKKKLGDIKYFGLQRGLPFDAVIEVDDGHGQRRAKVVGTPSVAVWDLIQVGGWYEFHGIGTVRELGAQERIAVAEKGV